MGDVITSGKPVGNKGDWERFIVGEPAREDLQEATQGYRSISNFIDIVLKEKDTLDCTKILEIIANRCDKEIIKIEKIIKTWGL